MLQFYIRREQIVSLTPSVWTSNYRACVNFNILVVSMRATSRAASSRRHPPGCDDPSLKGKTYSRDVMLKN